MNTKQVRFLQQLNELTPPNSSIVNEISDLLNISIDSAYRRLRGQTIMDLDEIITLCRHYHFSFDSFMSSDEGTVSFNYTNINGEKNNFEDLFNSLYRDISIIESAKNKQIIYACQDIPVFYHYKYPILAAFKIFYWMKSIMNVTHLQDSKFDSKKIPEDLKEKGEQLYQKYQNIPTIEIWSDSTIRSILKQIGFYWESGGFEKAEDALNVCEALTQEMQDIEKKAAKSSKIESISGSFSEEKPNYTLYYSEVELGNNCLLVDYGDLKSVYLGHFSFNIMSTHHQNYCQETENG